jgi:hypothetical protein
MSSTHIRSSTFVTIEDNLINLAKKILAGEEHETEVIIENASHRAHQAKFTRGLVQQNTELTVQSILDGKHHPERNPAIICDSAHNINTISPLYHSTCVASLTSRSRPIN